MTLDNMIVKKLFVIELLLLLFTGAASGQVKNQRDASGRKQGYWEAVDRSGKLVYTGYFKDDKPVGEMKRYHPAGGVRVIMVYDNKSEKARARFFWQNGELAAEGNYINTKKDSVWLYYSYYSKTVSYRITYTSGLRNGVSHGFYPNGQIAEEIHWNNDKKNGVWQQFFNNGRLKLSSSYENDQLEGPFTAYYPDGKKESEGVYRNGLPSGKWMHYDNNGTVMSGIEYENGQIINVEELEATEREFFKKIEAQKDRIPEPVLEDMLREIQ